MKTKKKTVNRVSNKAISYETKIIIVVLTLVFVYPVGVLLMYVWMKWNKTIKFFVTLPAYVAILVLIAGFLSQLSPRQNADRTLCSNACKIDTDQTSCVKKCMDNLVQSEDLSPTPYSNMPLQ